MSIDRLKRYHGNITHIPKQDADIEMSDDEFVEHLHLAKDSGSKENQGRRAAVEKKEKKGENDSEDDPEELGPTQQPRRGTLKLATSHRQQPSTPLTRAQAAIKRAAAQQQRQN